MRHYPIDCCQFTFDANLVSFSKVSAEFYRNDVYVFLPNQDYYTCNLVTCIKINYYRKSVFRLNSNYKVRFSYFSSMVNFDSYVLRFKLLDKSTFRTNF